MELKVVSYNIHKGYTTTKSKYVLPELKRALMNTDSDLIFLQEMHGRHPEEFKGKSPTDDSSPLEQLADTLWPHYAYGKNSIYSNGDHGNAILSRFPIAKWSNTNISTNRFEKRGLLHGLVEHPELKAQFHSFCVHLNLLQGSRILQLAKITQLIEQQTNPDEPIILAGDFNDWPQKASNTIKNRLGLKEVFFESNGGYAKTYPSWMPLLRLDRIYVRGFEITKVEVMNQLPWNRLSDHLPIVAHLNWKTAESNSTASHFSD